MVLANKSTDGEFNMNRPILNEIADWMLDCELAGNKAKAKRIETVYERMFDRQWKHTKRKTGLKCKTGKDHMKKLIVFILIALTLTGCGSVSEANNALIMEQEQKIANLKSEIHALEQQKSDLEGMIVQEKVNKGVAKYIVTINIKQSHPFWDIENNIKDEMNDIDIEIPVDKEYYDSVEVGTVINDEFRMGSLIMSSSIGNWDITVSGKEIR